MKRLRGLLGTSVFFTAIASVLFSGCEQEAGFECGRVVPGSSTIRICDRANEVCVCATNSCAIKVGFPPDERSRFDGGGGNSSIAGASARQAEERSDWGDCSGPGMTGYRYSDAPYAREDLAGTCVPLSALRLGPLIKSDALPNPGCPGQVELPDATTGGTGGAGGMTGVPGGGAAGMSSGGAGAGGAGGESGSGARSGGAGNAGGMSGTAGEAGAKTSSSGGA